MKKEKLWYSWGDFSWFSKLALILSILALIGVLTH